MWRAAIFIAAGILTLGIVFRISFSKGDVAGLHRATTTPTPTFDPTRLAQPPTVYPPAQSDIGAQTYWGMCMSCHGDRGQGLTEDWLNSFPLEERDCWQSGCHADDAPQNSFEIPQTGIPALVGTGVLSRFSNSLELQRHILDNMPFGRAGLLPPEEAWTLTSHILQMNGR